MSHHTWLLQVAIFVAAVHQRTKKMNMCTCTRKKESRNVTSLRSKRELVAAGKEGAKGEEEVRDIG